MENKDWREGLENRFVLSCNIMSSGIGRIEESELRWISNYWLSEIESLLQSKQEEIEKAMNKNMLPETEMKGDVDYMCGKAYNQAILELKPIISKLLK